MNDSQRNPDRNLPWPLFVAGLCVSMLGIVVYAVQFSSPEGFEVGALALMTWAAAVFVGLLVGFVFGIPRSLQGDAPAPPAKAPNPPVAGTSDEESRSANAGAYRANTSLEQISDWLTKILVGVGLVEFERIGKWLLGLGAALAPALGAKPSSQPFALALIVFAFVYGFFLGYLWTRLHLPAAFRQADEDALGKLGEYQQREENNRIALELVEQQVDADTAKPRPDGKKLQGALLKASSHIREFAFYRADSIRQSSLRTNNQARMDLVVPVLKAVVATDQDGQPNAYEHHASLGFALKDGGVPDWKGALDELSRAIAERDSVGVQGLRPYEANRADCRIHLDPNFRAEKKSDPATREVILSDLRAAAGLPDRYFGDAVKRWRELNEITPDDLLEAPARPRRPDSAPPAR